ncbi:MAG: zinc ribbon domain-containing protein [Gemmatimonadales bacterium]
MGLEALAAALVGLAALYLVLQPLLRPGRARPPVFEPLDPEETPKGVALAALKEIEFDRETGKLSDTDYEFLKAKYTGQALEALRAERATVEVGDVEAMIAARVRTLRSASISAPPPTSSDTHPLCSTCGPRPEPDAVFCSTCGTRLPLAGSCAGCGAALGPDSLFCERCGARVAA